MPDILSPRPWMVAPETREVLAALNGDDAYARFVGGCVRDAILGRGVKDIDIATPLQPLQVIRRLEAAAIKVVPTGVEHGTVTAILGDMHFEITTLRHDVETYGRHAKVAFTEDWRADAARRDFTMNAMSCSTDGTVFDPFGGYDDLFAGWVRFVGDPAARIHEDVLRLLRFYRFTAHYGALPPDPAGRAACRDQAHQIPTLSVERIRDETLKLFAAPDPAAMLEIMAADGILDHYLPRARRLSRLGALVRLERRFARPNAVRRLAAVLDVDGPGAREIARGLRLSNAQGDRLEAMSTLSAAFRPPRSGVACRRSLYRHGAGLFRDAALLHWAGRARSASAPYRLSLAEADRWSPRTLPIGGADVTALGIPPGPRVGEILGAVETWWLERDFQPSRADTLERLKSIAKT